MFAYRGKLVPAGSRLLIPRSYAVALAGSRASLRRPRTWALASRSASAVVPLECRTRTLHTPSQDKDASAEARATAQAAPLEALARELGNTRAENGLLKPKEADAGEGDKQEEEKESPWPEPTLEDLDRSIPQVDCEFIANLIRSRNVRRGEFLSKKEAVKQRVEALTKKTTKSVADAARLPRFGGLNELFQRAQLDGEEETSMASTSPASPVLASTEVLAQLTPEEQDFLTATRPEYDDGFLLLDCRTVNEVTSWGIIEGAKVLPAHELFEAFHATPEDFEQAYGFPKPRPDEVIICYCQYGPRSLMAAQILSWMGYLKVLHFRDGYYEWGKQYNLLLRRWMEHDRESGNELRRLATFRAALEMQREIAPEFNALPMQEAEQYDLDTTRSRGTLLIGEGLRLEAYTRVATLIEGMPPTLLPGVLDESSPKSESAAALGNGSGGGGDAHLTKFLEQTTGLDPKDEGQEDLMSMGEVQAKILDAYTNRDGSSRIASATPPRRR